MLLASNYETRNDFLSENIFDPITSSVNSSSANMSKHTIVSVPMSRMPGPNDVICGRGSSCFNHEGNRSFRNVVDSFVDDYINASNKLSKSFIISIIVDHIRGIGGKFIRRDRVGGLYCEVNEFIAREKISQAFRDAISRQETSAKKSRNQYKYTAILNRCKIWNEKHQKSSGSSQTLNPNLFDSMVSLENSSIAPSFFNFPHTASHSQPMTLTDNEDDDFDKMIDDVIRPLQEESPDLTLVKITPSWLETSREDILTDAINLSLSSSRFDNSLNFGESLNNNIDTNSFSLSQCKQSFVKKNEMYNNEEEIESLPADFSLIFDDE